MEPIQFIFFGSSQFSTYVLKVLESKSFLPSLIVTSPDKPQGRKMLPKPNPVKEWAQLKNIKILEITNFKDPKTLEVLKKAEADLFIVASFGLIIPELIINLPPHKTLNVHPSLLPIFRGPSPIQNTILNDVKAGVSIMRINERVDQGPILTQKEITLNEDSISYTELEKILGYEGGKLLAETLIPWIKGEIEEKPQDDSLATYSKKINKEDGNIENDHPTMALRKIRAFEVWPRTFINYRRKDGSLERVIILSAHIEDDQIIYDRIIPAGKKEMKWSDYILGN